MDVAGGRARVVSVTLRIWRGSTRGSGPCVRRTCGLSAGCLSFQEPSHDLSGRAKRRAASRPGHSMAAQLDLFCDHRSALPSLRSPLVACLLTGTFEAVLTSHSCFILSFIPKLSGVLLAHSDLRFLEDKATIQADCPFAVVDVRFGALVWAPEVGQVLCASPVVMLSYLSSTGPCC
jgi:hypothetical protein